MIRQSGIFDQERLPVTRQWQAEGLRRLWVKRFGDDRARAMSRVFAAWYGCSDTQLGGEEIVGALARAVPFRITAFFGHGYFWPDTSPPLEGSDQPE